MTFSSFDGNNNKFLHFQVQNMNNCNTFWLVSSSPTKWNIPNFFAKKWALLLTPTNQTLKDPMLRTQFVIIKSCKRKNLASYHTSNNAQNYHNLRMRLKIELIQQSIQQNQLYNKLSLKLLRKLSWKMMMKYKCSD